MVITVTLLYAEMAPTEGRANVHRGVLGRLQPALHVAPMGSLLPTNLLSNCNLFLCPDLAFLQGSDD